MDRAPRETGVFHARATAPGTRRLTRRQALGAVVAAGAALWPAAPGASGMRAGGPVYRWRGAALGARASIVLYGEDAARAAGLRPGWEAELRRLDGIFSLYRRGSALCRLNRDGGLDAPPPELVELLSVCRGLHRATGGVFDPTVQPLWELYARRFSRWPEAAGGPDRADREQVLEVIGLHRVEIAPARIEFGRPGMGITLNGIAQGYLTDRIAAWLLRSGVANALVDVGEIRAFGRPRGRGGWRIGLAAPEGAEAGATAYSEVIELAEGAVATSSPAGYRFGGDPRRHHLFDARTGASALAPRTVTVVAPVATLADGLSTAFAMMPPSRARTIAAAFPGVTVHPGAAGRS